MAANGGRYPRTQPPKNAVGKHVHPSNIHANAFNRLKLRLKELFPDARTSDTFAFEWMVESLCCEDEELREYIEARDKLIRLNQSAQQKEEACITQTTTETPSNNSPDNPVSNPSSSNPEEGSNEQS